MAKYDQYSVTLTTGTEDLPLVRSLSLLFEEGDTESQIIEAADSLLIEADATEEEAIKARLLTLSKPSLIAILKEVWTAQMVADLSTARDYRSDLIEAARDSYDDATE